MANTTYAEVTPEEYLMSERVAETKHEYVAGEIRAMSGASFEHNLLTMNLSSEIKQQLKGRPCKVVASDMRVQLEGAKFYTYPDIVIVCGKPRLEDGEFDTLLNPTVIIEVLSPSTESYDRGEKFSYYQKITTLQTYILVSQDSIHIEIYTRQGDLWTLRALDRLDRELHLAAIDCRIPLADIYDQVELQGDGAGL